MKSLGRIRWGWLLLAGALASAGLNLYLGGVLRQVYRKQLAARIWPAPATDWPRVGGPTDHFTRTLLLLGDSRMAEWNLPPPPGTRTVNAGIPGATTAQIAALLPGLLGKFAPDTVVIEAGINDLKYLGLEPARADELVAHTLENLTNLAAQCREHHCRVVLLAVWPPTRPDWRRRFFWSPAISDSVDRVNRRLLALPAAAPQFQVVDLFTAAGVAPGPDAYRDTLHLRTETYRRLNAPLLNEPAMGTPAAP